MKAAYLINFAKFVQWPPDAFVEPNSPVIIGVAGDDPFGEILDLAVAGRKVRGRPFEVRRWRQLEDVGICHVLFVSSSVLHSFSKQRSRLSTMPMLTIAESESFISQGGMIRLFLHEDRVRFQISHVTAQKARLEVSSRLLALAAAVWE